MAIARKAVILGSLFALGMATAVYAATAVRVVRAWSVDRVPLTTVPGELVYVAIQGDGTADLALYILDGDGNVVASDAFTWSGRQEVFFLAPYAGTYYAAVENRSPYDAQYRIWIE